MAISGYFVSSAVWIDTAAVFAIKLEREEKRKMREKRKER